MRRMKRISRRFKDGVVVMGNQDEWSFTTSYELCGIRSVVKTKPTKCQRSIICDCERRRCPGKTYTVDYYTRKLKEA